MQRELLATTCIRGIGRARATRRTPITNEWRPRVQYVAVRRPRAMARLCASAAMNRGSAHILVALGRCDPLMRCTRERLAQAARLR